MHGLPIHTCCRTLLQCLRYYCLPQAGLLLTNPHLLTQTVASFILCEFEFNCGTRCGFLVGICTLMHECKISRTLVYCLHIRVFCYTLMQGCVCFANSHLFANAGVLFAKSTLYAAHWCIACYFKSLPYVDSVLIINTYILARTSSLLTNSYFLPRFANLKQIRRYLLIIELFVVEVKKKRVEREYTTPYWILLDFRKKVKIN